MDDFHDLTDDWDCECACECMWCWCAWGSAEEGSAYDEAMMRNWNAVPKEWGRIHPSQARGYDGRTTGSLEAN